MEYYGKLFMDQTPEVTLPPPVATQFDVSCNLTGTGQARHVIYVHGFTQAPLPNLEWVHFIIIICVFGCIQPIGVVLNLITLGTLCKDARNGGSISALLQALAVFDILYLASHFTGVFLPAFFQTISNATQHCVLSEVARVRVDEDNYFTLAMGISRDLVVWQMILVSEYCLIPYCCAGTTTRKLYNKAFAIFETTIVFIFVIGINVFMFLCKELWYMDAIANYYPLVEMFNVFLPFGCILVMYFGIVIQIISEKIAGRQPWDENGIDQLYRGFAAIFLFVICEVPFVIYWILRWNLVSFVDVFGYYIIAYTAILTKHVNSSIKLFIFCIASAKFRANLGKSCAVDNSTDGHAVSASEQDNHYPDKNCIGEEDRLMYEDDPETKRPPYLEVSNV